MSYLAHHGIKGQRWGIRRTPEQLGRINGGTAKVYKLHNYKGPLYFISEQDLDGKTLHPRIPQNYLTRNGFEDNTTERVCFSYDPGKCLTAMSSNVSGKTFNVYFPADKHDVYKPNNITVPDADVTGELWIKEPVKLKKVGSIKCTGDTGEDGLKYTYGDQEAELYDWNYEWLDRSDQTSSTKLKHTSTGGTIYIEGNALILGDSSYLEHHGIRGQKWGVRRYQNKDGTLTAAGRKRQQYLIEVGSGKRKRLIEAAKPIGTSRDYSRDVTGLNRRGIHGRVIDKDGNTHVIKKGTSLYRTAANPELNDDGTYASLTKNDVDRYIDYGRSGELPGADKSNLDSMKIFEFSANRDLKIANGKYITEIITDDVKRKMKNGDADQVKLGKEILESFKRYEEDLNLSFSTSEMRRSKEAYSRTEKEKEFDRDLVGKASDRLALYDKTILDYSSGKDYRVIRDRLKREGYDGFIDVEDVTTIENLVRGGANTEYPVVILNANDVLTLKRSVKESETQRRLKRGTKFNSSRGELTDVVQHTSIGGTMYIEGNALILGDSSYLEHHGIRGQRWGVRRFQNRDGSLTNAGRKRLGYATKGLTQTVGKAFKAGVKAGGKAVKAVKAHHEKAEAKKKEKKKEKASKTRLGVMANKDLFTNEEIRKLNERFKLEDEMKMATLQKGVEIAKAVGTIAQNVGTMAKAYEDVTGQSLSPIKRKAAEEKAKQDAEDRKRKLAKEDAETKRAEDKEKRDIEDRERRIKLEDEDRVRKQAKEDADAQRAENAEKRAQAKEQRDSSMAVELQRKAKAAADEQEHKAVKAKAESRSAILDVLNKIDKIQDHDDDDHNNPPGGGIDTWDDDDYLNFFKKTGIIHSDMSNHFSIQNGVLFIDSSDSFAHHGVKGQRWGVRRFQNEDGSLTDKGRKHYEKALAKEKRKQASSDAIRGTLERQHPFAVTGAAIMGAVAAGMSIAATGGASVAMIAAGSAISAAVSAGLTHVSYSASEAWEGRGTRMRSKKIDKYENILKQSDGENGMYRVENGTLFINAGEPYLEHHGVKGMKWGKHLMAGKGEAGAGGGSGEDDEKLKEMAKKAGMTVAEYRTKMAGKLSGAASKVGEKVYDAAGGSHKKEAAEYQKMSRDASNEARKYEASGNADLAKAASARRKGNTSAHSSYKTTGDNAKDEARKARERASALSEGARQEQARYEKSLAGKYDKMKADRARSKKIKQRQSVERALSNGPVEAKPKKGLGKRLEEKLGVTHEKINKPKQSKEAKRIEGMFKNAARKEKTFSGTSPKAKKAVIAKKKASPTSYEKRINDAKNSVEKAARSNEAAYKHATEVYRQTGRDSDAYKQAIKRSQTTLWRSLDNQERLKQKKRRPADIGKKRAKHSDDTNDIYTEGTRLVINSKWG